MLFSPSRISPPKPVQVTSAGVSRASVGCFSAPVSDRARVRFCGTQKMYATSLVPIRCGPASNANSIAEQNARLKGVKVVKPILLGSVAWYLGKERAEEGRTHQWTVYLRSHDHEDLSLYLRRVQFRLHDSFPDPNRVLTSPPFSVTETGWGEFDIAIKLFFVDNCERPVTMYHFLKLFHREPDGSVRLSSDPVHSEFYDELVFVDPSLKLYSLLNHPRMTTPALSLARSDYEAKKKDTLQWILEAKKKVKDEVGELRSRLTTLKKDILKLRAEVSAQ